MSNLLAMPLVQATILTGTNEDWIDTIKYVPENGLAPEDPNALQMDLRGIEFEMEVRRAANANEVVLAGSTKDGSLSVGAPPNYGFLIFNVGIDAVKIVQPGNYVGEIVGRDERYSRRVVQFDLTVVEGVVKWPSPA